MTTVFFFLLIYFSICVNPWTFGMIVLAMWQDYLKRMVSNHSYVWQRVFFFLEPGGTQFHSLEKWLHVKQKSGHEFPTPSLLTVFCDLLKLGGWDRATTIHLFKSRDLRVPSLETHMELSCPCCFGSPYSSVLSLHLTPCKQEMTP